MGRGWEGGWVGGGGITMPRAGWEGRRQGRKGRKEGRKGREGKGCQGLDGGREGGEGRGGEGRGGEGRGGRIVSVPSLAREVAAISTCCREGIPSDGGCKERRCPHSQTIISL